MASRTRMIASSSVVVPLGRRRRLAGRADSTGSVTSVRFRARSTKVPFMARFLAGSPQDHTYDVRNGRGERERAEWTLHVPSQPHEWDLTFEVPTGLGVPGAEVDNQGYQYRDHAGDRALQCREPVDQHTGHRRRGGTGHRAGDDPGRTAWHM